MPWKCKGVTIDGNTDRKHDEIDVNTIFCPQCGLTQKEIEAEPNNRTPQFGAAGLMSLALLVGGLVGGGYLIFQQFQSPVALTPGAVAPSVERPVFANQEDPYPSVEQPGFYKDVRYGISVRFPEAWELRKPSRNYPPDVFAATKDLFQLIISSEDNSYIEDDSYIENILVKIEQVTDDNLFLDDYANQQVARIRQIGTFNIESDQRIDLNGQSAREIIYSGHNGEYNLKRKRIIAGPALPGDYFFLVTYTANQRDYEKYMPDIEQVFNSILLLE